jgi:predicted nucleotidyltransferase
MEKQQLPEDFKEFIRCLNSNNVKYLLIGGWAVGLYGHPRATKDIDFLVFGDSSNLEKLGKALNEFGAPPVDINYLGEKGNIIRIGLPPIGIDIINNADGIDIKDCYSRKKTIMVEGIEIALISKEDLIINKKSTGRLSDLADVEKLEHINKKK